MMMTMMNSHNALCPELVNQFVARTGFAYLFRYLMCDGREKFILKMDSDSVMEMGVSLFFFFVGGVGVGVGVCVDFG